MTTLISHRTYLNDILTRQAERRKQIDPDHIYPSQPLISGVPSSKPDSIPSKSNVVNYIPEEETIRNGYEQWYGVSGEFGSNYILGAKDEDICEEYPALRKLMNLKSDLVNQTSHPPLYLPLPNDDPSTITSKLSPHKFDVILIHPQPHKTWTEISLLPIRQISSDPGFVFLWVGKGDEDGLERGRECFAKWGFRRAEDIVWVKTNVLESSGSETGSGTSRTSDGIGRGSSGGGVFASQKEHCLMGIRGTVRRSTDTRFVHCNVDTDVMVWEDSGEPDTPRTPPYLQTLIESFCLGTRRLQLFAPPSQSRRGWVTASLDPFPPPSSSASTSASTANAAQETHPFDTSTYETLLPAKSDGRDVLPYHQEVDALRPKSPVRRGRGQPGAQPGPGLGPGSTMGRGGFRPPRIAQGYGQGQPIPTYNPHPQYMNPPAGMGMGTFNPMMEMDPNLAMQFAMNPNLAIQMGMDPNMAMIMSLNMGQGMGVPPLMGYVVPPNPYGQGMFQGPQMDYGNGEGWQGQHRQGQGQGQGQGYGQYGWDGQWRP